MKKIEEFMGAIALKNKGENGLKSMSKIKEFMSANTWRHEGENG